MAILTMTTPTLGGAALPARMITCSCSLHYLWLQPPLPVVAASITCGCSLHSLWLQPLLRLQVASLSNLATVYEAMGQAASSKQQLS